MAYGNNQASQWNAGNASNNFAFSQQPAATAQPGSWNAQPAPNAQSYWSVEPEQPQAPSQLPIAVANGGPVSMVPVQRVEEILPALPEEEGSVYIPQMYTKPRPVIPRRRIISGFLSMLIVTLLLCGGAGYYAKVSGMLDNIQRFIGISSPPPIQPASAQKNIPDPKKREPGPAANMVDLAVFASTTTENGNPGVVGDTFAPGTKFYFVTGIKLDKNPATITIKVYTDGEIFNEETRQTKTTKDGDRQNIVLPLIFDTPLSGQVEVYWNGKLAQRSYFAVKTTQ
ncbi:hypothetical protein [Thermosporothrix hazakensis]|jgi:hypothetical protein|nr:hypothetical protein [Thermosporothrix hazakensis]